MRADGPDHGAVQGARDLRQNRAMKQESTRAAEAESRTGDARRAGKWPRSSTRMSTAAAVAGPFGGSAAPPALSHFVSPCLAMSRFISECLS